MIHSCFRVPWHHSFSRDLFHATAELNVASLVCSARLAQENVKLMEFIGKFFHIVFNLFVGDACIDLRGADVGMS